MLGSHRGHPWPPWPAPVTRVGQSWDAAGSARSPTQGPATGVRQLWGQFVGQGLIDGVQGQTSVWLQCHGQEPRLKNPSARFSAPSQFPASNMAGDACCCHLWFLKLSHIAAAPQCLLYWAQGLWQSGEEGVEPTPNVGKDASVVRKWRGYSPLWRSDVDSKKKWRVCFELLLFDLGGRLQLPHHWGTICCSWEYWPVIRRWELFCSCVCQVQVNLTALFMK